MNALVKARNIEVDREFERDKKTFYVDPERDLDRDPGTNVDPTVLEPCFMRSFKYQCFAQRHDIDSVGGIWMECNFGRDNIIKEHVAVEFKDGKRDKIHLSKVSYKPLNDYTFCRTNDYVIAFKGRGEQHAFMGKVVAKAENKFVIAFADNTTKILDPGLVWRLAHLSIFPDDYDEKEDCLFYLNRGLIVLFSFVKDKKVVGELYNFNQYCR